jgi:hypothetical protein
MKRYDLINYLIKKFNYKTYLEIGVDGGDCFSNVTCDHKTSVDPAEGAYSHARPTYKTTSDVFFTYNTNKFDIIYIDGLHHSEQVDKDIENSIRCLSENGVVVLHDSNPETELCQRVPRESDYWLGDVWKSVVKYRSKNSNPGCKVLRLMPNEEDMAIIKNTVTSDFTLDLPNELTYDWLVENREKAVGLIVDVEEFLYNLK